jgi:hypothetical protein
MNYGRKLFDICFSLDKGIFAIRQFKIALIVAEVVYITGFSAVLIGEVAELKTVVQEFCFCYLGLAVRIQSSKNPAIFSKDIVDVPHEIGGITVQLIVMSSTTLVRAESFIYSPEKIFAAYQTFFFQFNSAC